MSEPGLGLAFISTEAPWLSDWRAFFRDHGHPDDVIDVIAERRTTFDRPWWVLVGGVGSALLDKALVSDVHERHRAVIAVYDPDDVTAKQRALSLGVDDVIESTATAVELAEKAREVMPAPPVVENQPRRRPSVVTNASRRTGQVIAVGGPVGAQPEAVAIAMARHLGRRGEPTLLFDANEVCASVAQLLGLAPVPNLASVIAAYRASADVDEHLQAGDGFYVLGGLADSQRQWTGVTTGAVMAVLTNFAARFTRTVATLGPLAEGVPRFATTRAVAYEADAVVVVAEASPVGMARLAAYVADLRSVAPTTPLYLAAGKSPGDRFRQSEVLAMMADLGEPTECVVLPHDDRLARAQWQGTTLRRGPLYRSVASLTATVAPPLSRRSR